jgi:hypothetical protein
MLCSRGGRHGRRDHRVDASLVCNVRCGKAVVFGFFSFPGGGGKVLGRVFLTVQGRDRIGFVNIPKVLSQLRYGWLGTVVALCRWLMEEVACNMISSLNGIAS